MAFYPQKGNVKQYWIMDYELFIKNGMFAVRSDVTSLQYALLSLKIKKVLFMLRMSLITP